MPTALVAHPRWDCSIFDWAKHATNPTKHSRLVPIVECSTPTLHTTVKWILLSSLSSIIRHFSKILWFYKNFIWKIVSKYLKIINESSRGTPLCNGMKCRLVHSTKWDLRYQWQVWRSPRCRSHTISHHYHHLGLAASESLNSCTDTAN